MAANSFLSGFTGGMGAMSQVMNYAEQRQARQQQQQDQQLQRNISGLMHIDREFGDDNKKRQAWRNDVFQSINKNKNFRSALELEQPGSNITAFETMADGFVPIISYTGEDGNEVSRPVMMEGSNKPLVIPHQDFFQAIGSQTDILDSATRHGAQLLGAGGSLPERSERYQQEKINGGLYNRNLKTNELKSVGRGGSGSRGGGTGSSDLSFGNPTTTFNDNAGNRVEQYDMPYGKTYQIIRPSDGEPGEFEVYDITDKMNPKNVTGGANHVDRVMHGVGGMQENPAVDTRPFYEWGTGTGGEAESEEEEEEDKPTEKPKDRPKRTPVTPGSLDTGYGGFKVPREQMERAESARSEDIAGLANLVRQQQKNSQLGQQNMANARTHYGGMINPQSPQQQVAKPENAKSEKGQIEQVYDEVERIISGGGTEKELTEYLSQFDDSVTRKVQQMRINAGKLVSDRGGQ